LVPKKGDGGALYTSKYCKTDRLRSFFTPH
jgi:hypothetical protein